MDPGIATGDWLLLAGVLLATGLATGLVSGLLGIGGGGIMVPVLFEVFRSIGVDPAICIHLAVGTSLSVIIPTSLRSYLSHRAKGAVDGTLLRAMAVPVILGVGLGVLLARFSDDTLLKAVWAACGALMAAKLFFGRESWRLGAAIPGNPGRALYGTFVGLVSTLMSIGGGAFITAFMTLYGRPIHQAIATASGFGPIIAVPGALGFAWAGWHVAGLPPGSLGYVNLVGTAMIVPASVLAAPLGVRIAHGISRRKLELAFATFLTLVALRFFYSLLA
ncbi:MAG: sulfite exporter TauE/SafE family protein [Pseudomonadota bacterium]